MIYNIFTCLLHTSYNSVCYYMICEEGENYEIFKKVFEEHNII